jgi:hypothetical protein
VKVGCEDDDGLLIVHDETETCGVCAPKEPANRPDGLYVIRSGVATAVAAEQMLEAAEVGRCWYFIPPLDAFERLLAALTQAQGGAEHE